MTAQNPPPAVMAGNETRYRTKLRPVGAGGIPRTARWKYVEAPPDVAERLPDLPVSRYRYGVFVTDRPLTAEEMDHFDIEVV